MKFWRPPGTSDRCRVAAIDTTMRTIMAIHVYSTWSGTPGMVRIGGCSMAPMSYPATAICRSPTAISTGGSRDSPAIKRQRMRGAGDQHRGERSERRQVARGSGESGQAEPRASRPESPPAPPPPRSDRKLASEIKAPARAPNRAGGAGQERAPCGDRHGEDQHRPAHAPHQFIAHADPLSWPA